MYLASVISSDEWSLSDRMGRESGQVQYLGTSPKSNPEHVLRVRECFLGARNFRTLSLASELGGTEGTLVGLQSGGVAAAAKARPVERPLPTVSSPTCVARVLKRL
jgi:hypothetical protein